MSLDQFASAMGVGGRWQDNPAFYVMNPSDNFFDRKIRVEVNGQNGLPDNLIQEEPDWSSRRCYIDLDTLACYGEDQVEIIYTGHEAWREGYYKLLSELKQNGSLFIEGPGEIRYDERDLKFQLVKWAGQEFPLLYISNTSYRDCDEGFYFMFQHGEPVFLCHEMRSDIDGLNDPVEFIEGRNLFVQYGDSFGSSRSWYLYEISESGEPHLVACLDLTIPSDYSEQFESQGVLEGIPLLPEDFVEAYLRGEDVSYDVFMENLQNLFGADGARQIMTQSENGPLNIVSAPETEGGYSMNEIDAVFFG